MFKMPFKGLRKKIKIEPMARDGQQKKGKNAAEEEHFEEISLDSRKRKETIGSTQKRPMTGEECQSKTSRKIGGMAARKFVCIAILFLINLLNYMDRFTIAGVLTDVIHFYGIDDQMAGFLQTVFILFFMIFAPICGFLGDRFNRKRIIMVGETIWVGAVLASSFIPSQHFWAFVLLRGVVGIGEASYAVIAPTLIADMFAGKMRSRILMFFYFAIPVGSGLGYVVGSSVTSIAKGGSTKCDDCWQWGIRATPIIGLISLVALILGVEEPKRGQAEIEEGENGLPNGQSTTAIEQISGHPIQAQNDRRAQMKRHLRTAGTDLAYLARNRTFVWSTVAYTAVVFVTGTLTWWAPAAIEEATAWHQNISNTSVLPNKSEVSLTFGIITCLGGVVGVAAGSVFSMAWKQGKWFFAGRPSPKADPLISALGSFGATPLLFLAIKMIDWDQFGGGWTVLFLTIVCLCLNWAINVDMLMSIIVPHRRAIASAVQILISHAFGDASGPWILGAISDWVRGPNQTPEARFHALMVAFYLPNMLLLLSGFAFLCAALALPESIRQMEEWRGRVGAVQGEEEPRRETDTLAHQRALDGGRNGNGIPNEAFE